MTQSRRNKQSSRRNLQALEQETLEAKRAQEPAVIYEMIRIHTDKIHEYEKAAITFQSVSQNVTLVSVVQKGHITSFNMNMVHGIERITNIDDAEIDSFDGEVMDLERESNEST